MSENITYPKTKKCQPKHAIVFEDVLKSFLKITRKGNKRKNNKS